MWTNQHMIRKPCPILQSPRRQSHNTPSTPAVPESFTESVVTFGKAKHAILTISSIDFSHNPNYLQQRCKVLFLLSFKPYKPIPTHSFNSSLNLFKNSSLIWSLILGWPSILTKQHEEAVILY